MSKFTCARCKQTFTTYQTELEKQFEYQANFGKHATEVKGSLCDDCYEAFWRWAAVNAPELKRII